MKKLKVSLIIVSIAALISACGSNNIAKQNVKPVNTTRVDNTSKPKEGDLDKNKESSQSTVSNSLDQRNSKSNIVESNKKLEEKSSETINSKKALPKISYKLTNKTIVIDPGHSSKSDTSKEPVAPNSSTLKDKQTGGAEGVLTKAPEYKINMDVALRLKQQLEAKGFNVIMTKTDNNKTMSNIARAKLGNEANAALVIRIHADSSESKSPKGASMLVPANNTYTKGFYSQSKLFGQVILNTVTNNVGMNNRGVVERSDMTGFNWSTVPVVLIEMGFLSNPEEDKNLSDSDYQEKIAKAISDGVVLLSK